ncbi:hypothetical protein KSS87_003948 [Heliosperma pusillum]|nr:hypothetical protein KSS87_003948 [Heliosperma pusillum]
MKLLPPIHNNIPLSIFIYSQYLPLSFFGKLLYLF